MAINLPIVSKFDDKGIQQAQSGLDRLGNFAKGAGIALGAAFVAAGAAAVAFGASSLKAAAEAEAVSRGLENAAKNAGVFGDQAGAIAKVTKELDKHSKSLGEMTGYDDELINQIKTGWLAVPDLAAKGVDGINKLAKVTADIAKGTGKDISAVAMAFTKVAGDSETALSKLTRIGIVLSDAQKQTYNDILATNGEIAAQDYLIAELGKKYEGAAESMANPFERLDVIMGNLKETIGLALLPAFEQAIPLIQSFIENLTTSPEFQQFLADMGTNFTNMLPALETTLTSLGELGMNLLPTLSEMLPTVNDLVGLLSSAFDLLTSGGSSSNGVLSDVVTTLGNLAYFGDLAMTSLSDLGASISSDETAGNWAELLGFINPITSQLSMISSLTSTAREYLKYLTGDFESATDQINKMLAAMRKIPFVGGFVPADIVKYGVSGSQGQRIPGQAEGGITARGGLSWVGEKGPELLNLPTGAQVIPLDRIAKPTGGGNTINVTINAGMGADGANIGEQIVTAIRKYERTSGAVFARA